MLVKFKESRSTRAIMAQARDVLQLVRAEGLRPEFEVRALRMCQPDQPLACWRALAVFVTCAHVHPGIYADGRQTSKREEHLTQLEMLLAELLVAMRGLR